MRGEGAPPAARFRYNRAAHDHRPGRCGAYRLSGRSDGDAAHAASLPFAASPYDDELAEAAGRLRAEARKPQGASAVAVLAGLDEQVPAKALEQAVQAGLVPNAHPLVSAQAAWLAAHLAEERGDRAAANRLRGRLGLVTEGYAIGPFGEGRASFGTVYPPEREGRGPDLTKSHPGKGHEVRWRSVVGRGTGWGNLSRRSAPAGQRRGGVLLGVCP